MNSTIGITVEIGGDQRHPHHALAARLDAAGEQRDGGEADGAAGRHAGRERDRGGGRGHAVGGEDEAGVEDRAPEGHRRADPVDGAGAAADHERHAAGGERQRGELAAGRLLAPERKGADGHERGIGVEDQRGEADVDALDRAEVEAGLDRVAAQAEQRAERDAAQRAERAAAERDQQPTASPRRSGSAAPASGPARRPPRTPCGRRSAWRRSRRPTAQRRGAPRGREGLLGRSMTVTGEERG